MFNAEVNSSFLVLSVDNVLFSLETQIYLNLLKNMKTLSKYQLARKKVIVFLY